MCVLPRRAHITTRQSRGSVRMACTSLLPRGRLERRQLRLQGLELGRRPLHHREDGRHSSGRHSGGCGHDLRRRHDRRHHLGQWCHRHGRRHRHGFLVREFLRRLHGTIRGASCLYRRVHKLLVSQARARRARQRSLVDEAAEVVGGHRDLAAVQPSQSDDQVEAEPHDDEDGGEGNQRVEVPRRLLGVLGEEAEDVNPLGPLNQPLEPLLLRGHRRHPLLVGRLDRLRRALVLGVVLGDRRACLGRRLHRE
mmetsp:Transcript_24942/g.59754  ORF Transcript_24942/g.59754 Transcript_24942/m.59754 type:complete len:252 (-) Transcript_24942:476-1231(-)